MTQRNKTFRYKLLTLVVILVAADQIGGRILGYYFEKSKTPEFSRIHYVLDESKEDILIFGSSRACHHYIPSVFQDSLGQTAYNAGKDGHYISYANGLLTSVLARRIPKTIILDINPFEFEKAATEDITPLLPYYGTHSELKTVINQTGKYERFKMLSRLYRYNSLVISIIAYNGIKENAKDSLGGFIPMHAVWNNPIETKDRPWAEIDEASVKSFRDFILACKGARVDVRIIISPRFVKQTHPTSSQMIAKQICLEYDTPFYDFSDDVFFQSRKEYFSDPDHLNYEGAKLYSAMMTKLVKRFEGSVHHSFVLPSPFMERASERFADRRSDRAMLGEVMTSRVDTGRALQIVPNNSK